MESPAYEGEYEQYLEKSTVVMLREDRYLYGVLKSFDQYNSIALNFVTERIFHENCFAERRLGLVSLRGENIVLIGICSPDLKKLKKVEYDTLLREIDKNKEVK